MMKFITPVRLGIIRPGRRKASARYAEVAAGTMFRTISVSLAGSNISRTYPFATKIYSKVVKKPEKGAETPVYLASSEDIKDISGKYFVNKKDVKSSKFSYDRTLAQKLWTATEELTGIKEK